MRTTCFGSCPRREEICSTVPPPHFGGGGRPPGGQTNTCESITFPQLCDRAVIMSKLNSSDTETCRSLRNKRLFLHRLHITTQKITSKTKVTAIRTMQTIATKTYCNTSIIYYMNHKIVGSYSKRPKMRTLRRISGIFVTHSHSLITLYCLKFHIAHRKQVALLSEMPS